MFSRCLNGIVVFLSMPVTVLGFSLLILRTIAGRGTHVWKRTTNQRNGGRK
jgi:hypothetical protein